MPTSVKIVPKRPRARSRRATAWWWRSPTTACAPSSSAWRSRSSASTGRRWAQTGIGFRVAAIEPGPLRAAGGIRVESDGGLRLIERAGTIIVPGWRGAEAPRAGAADRARCSARTSGARACCRSARACSCWRRPGCSTASGRRRTGATPSAWPSAYPAHLRGARRALRRRGQSAHGRRQRGRHRPEPAPHPPRLGRGGRQQRGASPRRASRIATAARRSSSRRRCPRPGKGGGSGRCSSACAPSRRARRAIAALARDGRHEPPHVPAPLQGQHGHDARRLAGGARAWRGRASCWSRRDRGHRGGRGRGGLRLGRHPAPPLPQADEAQPRRLTGAGSGWRRAACMPMRASTTTSPDAAITSTSFA